MNISSTKKKAGLKPKATIKLKWSLDKSILAVGLYNITVKEKKR